MKNVFMFIASLVATSFIIGFVAGATYSLVKLAFQLGSFV